jgi:hypothetical protein
MLLAVVICVIFSSEVAKHGSSLARYGGSCSVPEVCWCSALVMRDPIPLFRFLFWLASQPLVWAALGIVVGPYWFYRGFRLLQRKRLILDIPRSTIRGAAVGAVEISGKAVVSLLSGFSAGSQRLSVLPADGACL